MTRKHNTLSVYNKLEVLKRLDNGETAKMLAEEFKVGTSTISDWKKNRNKLEEFAKSSSEEAIKNRKTTKTSKLDDLDKAVYIWFCQERLRGSPITGPMVQEKAKEMNEKLNLDEEFSASQGWLDRWKKRHGVRQLSISGESASADTTEAENFVLSFPAILEGLSPQQVYNADEMGLAFKQLPSKSLASKEEKRAPGFKMNKQRLTVMACSNATGNHKLPLLVIGKSASPRAFKGLNLKSLPVKYTHQKRAWMDSAIFSKWFHEIFVPAVTKFNKDNNLPQKALLIIDNAPCHPNEKDLIVGDIKTIFLPPNVTSILQPMDQQVLQQIKRQYKKRLLQALVKEDIDISITEKLKKINVKDVIFWVAEAWNNISENCIQKSWKKLWPSLSYEEDPPVEVDVIEFLELMHEIPGCEEENEIDLHEWLCSKDYENLYSTEEILDMVKNNEDETDSEIDSDVDDINIVSHAEAASAMETALKYIEQHKDSTAVDVMFMQRWRAVAATSRYQSQKQKKLTDFFVGKK